MNKIKLIFFLIALSLLSCAKVNDNLSVEPIVTYFSCQPSRFLFLLDSIGVTDQKLKVDSIHFVSKSSTDNSYLNFPNDSIILLSHNKSESFEKVFKFNRHEYINMEIAQYNIDDLLNQSEDSLKTLMKFYIKTNFKLVIFKDGRTYCKDLNDTSKIILNSVYWGVD